MQVSDLPSTISSSKQRLAWLVAMAVDAVQIVALPLFAEGGLSPLDTVLDILAATALVKLLGWHWAFAPAFLVELVPGLDLFPTWTAAVFYVTRQRPFANVTQQRVPPGQPEIIPPDAGTQQ
jgi:hypothetical protein